MIAALVMAMALTGNQAPRPAALEGMLNGPAPEGCVYEHNTMPDSFHWASGAWVGHGPSTLITNNCATNDASGDTVCGEDTGSLTCVAWVLQSPAVGGGLRYFEKDCDERVIIDQCPPQDGCLHAIGVTEITQSAFYWLMGQNMLGKSQPCYERGS